MPFSIETEEDNTKRFVFNNPPDGNDKYNNIHVTARGLVQDCQGNDNPNAQPEVLEASGNLDSKIPPHLMDFRFVDGIQTQTKLPWQNMTVQMQIDQGWPARYNILEWGYAPTSVEGGGEVRSYGGGSFGIGSRTQMLVVVVHFSCPVFVAGHTYHNPHKEPMEQTNVVPASGTPYITITRNIPGQAQDTEILTYTDMSQQSNYNSTTQAYHDGSGYFTDTGASHGPYYDLSNRQYYDQFLYENGSHSMAFVSKGLSTSSFPPFELTRKTGTTYSIPANALNLNGGTITEGTSSGGDNVIITNDAARGAKMGTVTLSSDYYLANPTHYGLYVSI